MVKVQEVSVSPLLSVTVYATCLVSPVVMNVPDWTLETMDATPATSVAVGGLKVTVAPGVPNSTDWTMFEGQLETVGGVVSSTETEICLKHVKTCELG